MRNVPTDFNSAYADLLREILLYGVEEVNTRTGVKIKANRGAYSFKVDCSRNLPVAGNRKMFPHVAAAEVAWQFMGTQDPEFIVRKAPKLWSNFVEDGKLKTAYGYRWRKHFGRDQLAMAIDQLQNNPTNRQLFISAWDPATDGLGAPDQPKNIPCPLGFCLSVVDGSVHMSVFVRSSDVFVGLPYDTMAYALTLDAIANEVDLKTGTLTMTLAHPHIYEPHFDMATYCMQTRASWYSAEPVVVPGRSISEILSNPDQYVNAVKMLAAKKTRSDYAPLPDLVL